MSQLQAALRSGAETLESLTSKFAIKVKRHGTFPHLVQLKYDQINSPMAEPLVQECRGIIFDEKDDWRIVARPFSKFFNLGEGNAASIDWHTACVQEKLDGSLAIVYNYNGNWHMATSGTPDASGPVGDTGQTFRDLFWRTWHELGYKHGRENGMDPKYTYLFELMTLHNRVVVSHLKPRITLLGIRHTENGQEFNVSAPESITGKIPHWKYYDFEVVRAFPIRSEADVLASFENIDGLKQEGYVVVDAQFNRIKIKHPRYVLFHQLLGSLTQKKLLDAIRTGEVPEVLAYFPEWKQEADQLRRKYEDLVTDACIEYQKIRHIPVQKDFAREALKTRFSSAMFTVRAGKAAHMGEFFRSLRLEALADMLGLKETNDEQVEVQT